MPHRGGPYDGHRRPDFGQAWSWDQIEAEVHKCSLSLASFVDELRRRRLDEVIYGALGIEGLFLCMSKTWPFDGDVLRVGSATNGELTLTYLASVQEKPARLSDPYAFSKTYPADQVWPAFVRFLVRAHWFPKEHPKLSEVAL